MSARFNTILIPVDFTLNTEVAIAKAIGLVEGTNATIHLLHVHNPGLIGRLMQDLAGGPQGSRKLIEQKLAHLSLRINSARPGLRVSSWIEDGMPVEEAVTGKASSLSADLVVIGKHSSSLIFPAGRKVISAHVASATGIPVLTVKPGSLKNPIRTVVIPVGPKFPRKKLELLDAWKSKPGFAIRLVSCLSHDKNDACSKDSLLNTFRLLKTTWPGPVEYDVVRGNNQARALLKYCNKVNADMLIVYPGVETDTGFFPARHIADLLPPDSRTQILAIQPA
jgi:nucleotide-binding universal stress UspA family protein